MPDFLRVLAIFVLMLLLIWRKVGIGYVLLIGAVTLGLAFGEGPRELLHNLGRATVEQRTLAILVLVLLITFLGRLLKHTENLRVMVESLEGLFRDRRAVMAGAASLIGLMPMPGGAMLSAPLVGEVAERLEVSPERKTLINYWFRHVWEYTFPLYPGVILSAAIMHVPLLAVCAVNLPLTAVAIVVGTVFCFRQLGGELRLSAGDLTRSQNVRRLGQCIWPILAVVVSALALKYGLPLLGTALGTREGDFEMLLVLPLVAVNAVLLIRHKVDRQTLKKIAKDCAPLELCVLVIGIMVFGRMIEWSGAAEGMARSLQGAAVPVPVVVAVLPFLVGLLTGYTAAVIGTSFPLLLPLVQSAGGETILAYVMLGYGCGFVGVLLSPVHLCLVLSKDYFKADFGGVYRLLVAPCVCVLAAAWVEWGALALGGLAR
jgi:integral membrane protein (TIGR00529 family)